MRLFPTLSTLAILITGCSHIKSVRDIEYQKTQTQAPTFSEQVFKEFRKFEMERTNKRQLANQRVISSTVVILAPPVSGTFYEQGSGFFITPNHIVTNKHVVESACTPPNSYDHAQVYSDEVSKKFTVVRIMRSKIDDLAIIETLEPHNTFVTLGDLNTATIGDSVSVVGHPRAHVNSLSQGWITAKSVHLLGQLKNESLFQINASVSKGNSGGAVTNEAGEVLGVATSIYDAPLTQNLNYVTSVSQIKKLVFEYATFIEQENVAQQKQEIK